MIHVQIFHSLYSPKTWPALALAIAELQQRNGTLIYEMNNPNEAYDRTPGKENVFGRSMESSIASTAVRPFSLSFEYLLTIWGRQSCAATVTSPPSPLVSPLSP